jgi:hypothetical protein
MFFSQHVFSYHFLCFLKPFSGTTVYNKGGIFIWHALEIITSSMLVVRDIFLRAIGMLRTVLGKVTVTPLQTLQN